MIQIKLTADNVRMLRGAKTEAELRGCVDLVLERIGQAETVKSFGGTKGKGKTTNFGVWKSVYAVLESVLGKDNLRVPPYPDHIWKNKVYYAVTNAGMDEEYLRRLAQHAKDHMRLPIQMQFLVCMHERVMAGEWDIDKGRAETARPTALDVWKQTQMPEE